MKLETKKVDAGEVVENLVYAVAKAPGVKIDRADFLKKELKRYCDDATIETAINSSVKESNIAETLLDHIADGCIFAETTEVTAISAAAGFPGGLAMIGTIPADTVQFYAHVIRLSQKLAYIYGWDDIFEEELDDATKALLLVLLGVALGANGAASALSAIAKGAVNQLQKKIARTALTKTTWYPLLKKIAQYVGIKLTKDSLAKTLSKTIPVLGSLTSGGLTLATFRPMATRLKKHLKNTY